MSQAQTLHILDEETERAQQQIVGEQETRSIETVDVPSLYDEGGPVELSDYSGSYSFPKFVRAVCDRLEGEYDVDRARVVDAMPDTTDIEFGLLLVFSDETLLFIGSDPTAKDAIPWFCFAIQPMEPLPTPETAQDALDLLKPPEVRDIVHDEEWIPDRHGEWWLVPTNMVPVDTAIKRGVSERPYGASPLGNHVPTEYAFTRSEDEFMDRFKDGFPDAPDSIQTPREVIEWSQRQQRKDPIPKWAPSWPDIQECAGDVLVRGTIRHRDDDHFVERLGEQWHRALTHDVEVYTGDEIATDIHLDYHGG